MTHSYPSPADYHFVEHILTREREHIARELSVLSTDDLAVRLYGWVKFTVPTRSQMIAEVVDRECPRAWLDRRLAAL